MTKIKKSPEINRFELVEGTISKLEDRLIIDLQGKSQREEKNEEK